MHYLADVGLGIMRVIEGIVASAMGGLCAHSRGGRNGTTPWVSVSATDMHNVHTVLGVLYFTAHMRGGGHYWKGYKMTLRIHNFSDMNKSMVKKHKKITLQEC